MRYIGSKRNLLSEIKEMIDHHAFGDEEVFLDLFAGTSVVSQYFKPYYTIYTNDILYFSYIKSKALIENNNSINFQRLAEFGIKDPIEYLHNLKNRPNIGYYAANYSPLGNSMYFTEENARKIDAIRDEIDLWYQHNLITKNEYYYLVTALIEGIPFISNITGTYGAFLKHWDKRAYNSLQLQEFPIIDNNRKNIAFNENANELVKKIKADIVYIDTPYNNRQYASNYHLLENVARNNKPELKGKTKIFDWQDLKSDYSIKSKAIHAMSDLINNIDATHILLSYNNEGIISEEELYDILKKASYNGKVDIRKIPYRKYQSKLKSKNKDVYELLFYIQRKKKPQKPAKKNVFSTKVHTPQKYIKSPLNYIGGKFKLLEQIIPLFPRNINSFVDMFSGGANVGINATANKYIFNDMNYRINEMFRFFQNSDPIVLINSIEKRIKELELSRTNEEAYLRFRSEYNRNPNPLDLYILSSYSYNYQFRFNNAMQFNNPFGRNRSHFSDNMKKNLINFVARLQQIDAVFTDKLFTEYDISSLSPDDFVYLDPPYLITTGSYNDGNRGFSDWNTQQEKKLYSLMVTLMRQNIKFALSNVLSHKGKNNSLLCDFINEYNLNVHHLTHTYKNSSYNTKSASSDEVLITNYSL